MSRIVPAMRLNEHAGDALHLIRAWAPDSIMLGPHTYTQPVLVAPQALHADLTATHPQQLDDASLAALWALSPQVVLLGVGSRSRPAPGNLRAVFARRGVALEAMDLGAACRTYNVLAQEGRAVAALLFPGVAETS